MKKLSCLIIIVATTLTVGCKHKNQQTKSEILSGTATEGLDQLVAQALPDRIEPEHRVRDFLSLSGGASVIWLRKGVPLRSISRRAHTQIFGTANVQIGEGDTITLLGASERLVTRSDGNAYFDDLLFLEPTQSGIIALALQSQTRSSSSTQSKIVLVKLDMEGKITETHFFNDPAKPPLAGSLLGFIKSQPPADFTFCTFTQNGNAGLINACFLVSVNASIKQSVIKNVDRTSLGVPPAFRTPAN